MKISNLLGLLINLSLIVAGLALIVAPAMYAYFIFESTPFFSEAESGNMKGAIENIFYKQGRYLYGTDITPTLDDPVAEKTDLPAQMTPEVVTKFIMAQATINTTMMDVRLVMIWGPFIVGIFIAIGAVAILLGVSLLLIWRRLNEISAGKNPVKEVKKEKKNISLSDQNGKPRWKLIAAILAITVLVGAILGACINKLTQNFYSDAGGDGVCDMTVDGICDVDCPIQGPGADLDCTGLPAEETGTDRQNSKSNSYKTVALRDVIQYQVDINDKNTAKSNVVAVGTVLDAKFDDKIGNILLTDNNGYYIEAFIDGNIRDEYGDILPKEGEIIQVSGAAGFTEPASWESEKSFRDGRTLPEKIGLIYLDKKSTPYDGSTQINDMDSSVPDLMDDVQRTTKIIFSEIKPVQFEWLNEGSDGLISRMVNGLGFGVNQLSADKARLIHSYFMSKGFTTDLTSGYEPTISKQGYYKKANLVCKINDQVSDGGQEKTVSGPGSIEIGVPKGMELTNDLRDIELQCAESVR